MCVLDIAPLPKLLPIQTIKDGFIVVQKQDQKQKEASSLRKLALGFSAVTEVFASSIGGYLAGLFLDYWIVKTDPWMKVLFTFLGLIVGFYRLYKVYSKA
jgi:F0F1-type ATP synthase assembly protein I